MTAGDRFFGPNVATGEVVGTGGQIQVPLSFSPQSVEILNRDTGAILKWDKTMPQDSGMMISGGKVSLNVTTQTLLPVGATFFWIESASGNFALAEVVTGGTSGATGIVALENTDNQDDLGLNGIVGSFQVGETITGTSGTTAIIRSGSFSAYQPAVPVASFYGGMGTGNIGLASNGNALNATLTVTYSTLVGTFAVGETVTGGTSGNAMTVLATTPGMLVCVQSVFTAGFGMTLGETITGGTSGATAVVVSSDFDRTISYRLPSTQWTNGRFAVFAPTNLLASTLIVSYVGSNNAVVGTTNVSYVWFGGITSGNSGFILGTEPNINFPASVIYFEATR